MLKGIRGRTCAKVVTTRESGPLHSAMIASKRAIRWQLDAFAYVQGVEVVRPLLHVSCICMKAIGLRGKENTYMYI